MIDLQALLDEALTAVKAASKAIMEIYDSEFEIDYKVDESPVTAADQKAHEVIFEHLFALGFPVVSEENTQQIDSKKTEYFWLVDPLDGTKEFINKNGEFTINIALIKNDRPVLGVVAVPALQLFYWAIEDEGAYQLFQTETKRLHCSRVEKLSEVSLAVSRSHLKLEDEAFIERSGITKTQPLGSALKYCYIAEGKVDLSIRYAPLMQWDLAASDLIVHEAGGSVVSFKGEKYRYRFDETEQALKQGLVASNGLISLVALDVKG